MRVSLRCGLWVVISFAAIAWSQARERSLWDSDWRFHLGEVAEAASPKLATLDWRRVDLPHDWSVELPIDEHAPAGGPGGFFQNGIGWYRKTIRAPNKWRGQLVTLEFDGVYLNAEVFINGVSVGQHPNGFTPFAVELTPHLRFEAENSLAVRVDHSAQPTARFYTGSGIYRHVWLQVTSPVRVVGDSVFVTTQKLTKESAVVGIKATVANATNARRQVGIEIDILNTRGTRVARTQTAATLEANQQSEIETSLTVARPQPWSPDTPAVYRAVIRLRERRKALDEYSTPFGIRTLEWSATRGLELNGQSIKLNGGNVHHDTGILGAAAFDRAEERKVELLKAEGFNAVRTAHNPPSPAFLEACDRLGLLVMDEIFDGWAKKKTAHDYSAFFAEWWQSDLDAWVKRDRNHPSVILWSIGNEMYERASPQGRRIAAELANRIRSLDTTRPVSAGVNGPGKNRAWAELDPLFASLDIAGYNYELAAQHAKDHARLPERVMLASESYQSEMFENWAIVQQQPYVVGDFVWSALDYLGEAGIGRVFPPDQPAVKHWEGNMWPWHGAACGDIDLTGWRKPISHYRKIVWDRGEKLYVAVEAPAPGGNAWNVTPWSLPPQLPSWTWPGFEGTPLNVAVYSRCEVVRVFLNDQLIGEKPTGSAEEFRATLAVPYAAGTLRVEGIEGSRVVETFLLQTAGAPAALRLSVDRVKLRADGQDLAFVTVEAIDREGRWNPQAALRVEFSVAGAGMLAGVGTGDLTALDYYTSNRCQLYQGRALVVIRSKSMGGKIVLRAHTEGLADATCVIRGVQQ